MSALADIDQTGKSGGTTPKYGVRDASRLNIIARIFNQGCVFFVPGRKSNSFLCLRFVREADTLIVPTELMYFFVGQFFSLNLETRGDKLYGRSVKRRAIIRNAT